MQQQHKNKKIPVATLMFGGAVFSGALMSVGFAQVAPATPSPASPLDLADSSSFIIEDADLPPLPVEYVPMKVIQQDWKRRAALPKAVRDQAFMQPLLAGRPLPAEMQTLPGAVPMPPMIPGTPKAMPRTLSSPKATPPRASSKSPVRRTAKSATKSLNGKRLAQAIPPRAPGRRTTPRIPQPSIAPYPIRRAPQPTIPRWVRYPLEFQMCGIGIGTRAVDKDQYNRIDRYGLFAMHGNPTAVVVPTGEGGVTVTQTPPEIAALFPQDQDGGLPNWAAAITVGLDNNHVAWLYNRDTYAMSFVVDRLGFVDAIVVAGTYSPIAKTQLEDPIHTVQLGDDLRKVLFRYGYPDTIETYEVQAIAGAGVVADAGAGAGGTGSEGGSSGSSGPGQAGRRGAPQFAPGLARPQVENRVNFQQRPGGGEGGSSSSGSEGGSGGGAGGGVAGNAGFRTFELRYEQSYNVVFTIRDNRVVRIYIFGDPDFFNAQRRRALRTLYP
jgi:hypothetical protein